MRTIIIVIFLTSKLLGQKPCNLDKYFFLQNVRLDSNQTYYYYTDDDKYFIAVLKSSNDSSINYVFEKHILNLKGLSDITPNSVIIGTPVTTIDVAGKKTYYSTTHDKYIDAPTYTYIIKQVKITDINKKDFEVEIKVESAAYYQNFTIKYQSKKPLKTYKTFADKMDNSTMTCINFSGTDF